MSPYWLLLIAAIAVAVFLALPRGAGARRPLRAPERTEVRPGARDLDANINPSQSGNQVDLWPDRTGARTQLELGARDPTPNNSPGLAPEAQYGEDRPAQRTTAPDQPPTDWHPEEHGAPGDHIRDGHHRSATAPERKSTATDPFAHAPVPGPDHLPPEEGEKLNPGT